MRKFLGILAFLAAVSPALAQQIQGPKDAKDYRIEMLSAQRNEAADRLTVCYSENSIAIAVLQSEITKVKAELAEAQKKVQATPPPAAQAK